LRGLALVVALVIGCGSDDRPPPKPVVVEDHPAKVEHVPAPKRHASHEHAHGNHPHPSSDHHHHPHPHPHLDGDNGHHHPY
jgi:hypothetical protein